MVYELIDAKKLSLADTLSEFFPGLPNAGRITIAEMLGHRSGLANFTASTTNFDTWKEQPKTHEELLAFIKNQPPDFAPGTKADYNNSNFLLLGYILEKIYKKTYKEIVTERIINRLGLKDTYYGSQAGFQGREAASYKYFNSEWKQDRAVYLDDFGGAGAIISTPSDLCLFIQAVFDGKLVSKTSLERMKHIEPDGYGWGLFPYGDSSHTGYGHNGKTEGFGSSIQYYPAARLAIAYCTNGEVYPKAIILDHIFNTCFGLPDRLPTFDTVSLTQQQLQAYTGTYSGDGGMQVSGRVDNGRLVLETRGNQFILNALSGHAFWNVPFGFFFDFDEDGKNLRISDVDDIYYLKKQ
jgi:CubicO group peptidase (beta-lactamase class C family)